MLARMALRRVVVAVALAGLGFSGGGRAAFSSTSSTQAVDTEALDRVLDLFVRDGLVYYSALRAERVVIDRFVAALAESPPGFDRWPDDDRKAFWLNAYNVLVLQTVLDNYPIRGTSSSYPANSIRQVPGAFEVRRHRVAGSEMTLDEMENGAIAEFGDPRLFLALGRGAVDSGRLRSESYSGLRLDRQLDEMVEEFVTTPRYVSLDRFGRELRISAIFGWREAEFVTAFGDRGWTDSGRTALERAVLNVVEPNLFPSERATLADNEFTLQYHEFDWRLNDLTGGRPSNR